VNLYEFVLVEFDASRQDVEKIAGADGFESPTLGLESDALLVFNRP
jgi:hypothetical protein